MWSVCKYNHRLKGERNNSIDEIEIEIETPEQAFKRFAEFDLVQWKRDVKQYDEQQKQRVGDNSDNGCVISFGQTPHTNTSDENTNSITAEDDNIRFTHSLVLFVDDDIDAHGNPMQ